MLHRTGLAGLLFLSLAFPAAAQAEVTVRVEGQNTTLLPRTAVPQTDAPEPNTGCPGTSAAAAIERATNGDWDRKPYAQTILGESHTYTDSDYWALWVFRGGRFVVANGACDETLAPGEELLVGYERAPEPDYTLRIFPLWLTGVPATATAGVPFTVTVNRAACESAFCLPGEGRREPGAGATVTAGDATAIADAEGRATLTPSSSGPVTLRATAPESNPSAAEALTVDDPPLYPIPTDPGPPPVAPAQDLQPPFSAIRGIREQQVFRKRRRAPRTLRATVADEGALAAVALSITRKRGKRCSAFNDLRGRFVRVRCGRHPRFGVGTDKEVSFLLPRRLGRGRYVYDVVATDAAGNREKLARGRNRVVFHVR